MDDDLNRALESHPCYNFNAHLKFARMHVPVAPKCNIQCNYCNRKYDCVNESRPGVTSTVLTPEQAVDKVSYVKDRIPNLSVIGIAGPGDALANIETIETLDLLHESMPELTPCISTNGLMLPDYVQKLYDLGIRFVTVTINAPDAETGAKIYNHVLWKGKKYTGEEGAQILLDRQMLGIKMCADLGMLVKCNIVMVPGVNTSKIPELVKKVKAQGAYIINILPLIPVKGTKFENVKGPTPAERKALIDECSIDARMMRHCKQCRADAIGLLSNDRSAEFEGCGYRTDDGPACADDQRNVMIDLPDKRVVAVASDGGEKVDTGFGNASRFLVYSVTGDDVKFLREVSSIGLDDSLSGTKHKERIEKLVTLMDDCDLFIVKAIGEMPRSVIENRGKSVMISDAAVSEAIEKVVKPRTYAHKPRGHGPPFFNDI